MGGWTSEEPLKEVASDLGHLDNCAVLVIVQSLLYGPAWCSTWQDLLMRDCVHARIPEESQPPSKQVKPLFRHFRRIDSCLQTRVAFRGSDESEYGL